MNDFLKKLFTRGAGLWVAWSMRQRLIAVAVVIIAIVSVATLFRVSASPIMVAVIDAPINDENDLFRIMTRLNQENVRVVVSPANIIQVADEFTARRMRNILLSEGLIPAGVDPWQIFDRDRWTITDFERNVNFQRAQQRMITDHIRAVDGIDNASVTIVWPREELFASQQNPASVSVVITPTPGSNITEDRQRIEGIQRLLRFAIEGLRDENIVITDRTGLQLNDFEGMRDFDRLTMIERERRIINNLERNYRSLILGALQTTFSPNRVRDLNITIDMDMSRRNIDTTEHFPFTLQPRTPGLPFDDSVLLESVALSQTTSETSWEGTGFNPEGPTGVEGHVPPAFRDMSNLFGRMTQEQQTINHALNVRQIDEIRSPQIDRVTVSVNIDGTWRKRFDERRNPVIGEDGSIERIYTPIPPEVLRYTEMLIRDAIGFNAARGDSVTVTNIPFDRSEEFRLEDEAYFRQRQIQTTIIVFLSGLTLLLFGFILFRVISREMERRRRFAEEERARREQMLRESAMAEAEQEGMEVSISLEERNRMELMESVINMAKEHPEDAAQLIRTWLLEE